MYQTRLGKRLKFDEVFDEKPLGKEEYLIGFGREILMQTVPSLISAIYKSEYKTASGLIENWLSSQPEIKDSILKKFKDNDTILNISSSLDFAEFVLTNEKIMVERTKSDDEITLDTIKAYLLFNNDQEEAEKGLQIIESESDFEPLASLVISMNFHDYELNNYELVDIFFSELGKSIEFFKYLEQTESLKTHLEIFLNKYNCKNWNEWLTKYLPIIGPIVTDENQSFNDLQLSKDENFERNKQFLSMFSTANNPKVAPDYITIRTTPLMKIAEDKFRIISKQFILEKLYKSIQFEFSLSINKLVKKEQQIKDFRAIHCDDFSEQTLVYKFVNQSFPNKWIKKSGSDFKAVNYDGEPDYYVRFKNKIFLFESKDVILTGKEKQSRDSKVLNLALKKKFYKIENTRGEIVKKKAILQIIANIKDIFTESYSKIDQYNPEQVKIYPILIIHDKSFNSLGINQLLNVWFKNEVEHKFTLTQQLRIRPLVVLDISTLILYHELLRSRRIRLEEIIIKYGEEMNLKNSKVKRTRNLDQEYMDKMLSFSSYMDADIKSRKIRNVPKYISEIAEQIIGE